MKWKSFNPIGVVILLLLFLLSCEKTSVQPVKTKSGVQGRSLAALTAATITNDTWWTANGGIMYNQGGYIYKSGSTYYWFGVQYGGAYTYYKTGTKNSDVSFVSINCYSSTDMVNWSWVGKVLTPDNDHFVSSDWLGRIGVVHNPTTGKYVLIINYSSTTYGAGVAFATCSTLTGTYAYNNIQTAVTNVYDNVPGDQTVFVDDDGTPYLVFCDAHGRQHHYVAPLRTSDYLSVNAATLVCKGPSLEADNMFKHNGVYYRLMSELAGWSSSHTYWASATTPLGTTTTPVVMSGTDPSNSYNSQVSFVTPVTGTSGTTDVYVGDRWSDFSGNGTGYYVMEPLSWSGTTPSFNALTSWSLNAATGTWSQ